MAIAVSEIQKPTQRRKRKEQAKVQRETLGNWDGQTSNGVVTIKNAGPRQKGYTVWQVWVYGLAGLGSGPDDDAGGETYNRLEAVMNVSRVQGTQGALREIPSAFALCNRGSGLVLWHAGACWSKSGKREPTRRSSSCNDSLNEKGEKRGKRVGMRERETDLSATGATPDRTAAVADGAQRVAEREDAVSSSAAKARDSAKQSAGRCSFLSPLPLSLFVLGGQ